jgi:mevalonate kinase
MDTPTSQTTGRAHAKAILLGEHAVVAGAPALVAGLPAGMVARDGGEADALCVAVSPWGFGATADPAGEEPAQALAALDDALAGAGLSPRDRARRVTVEAAVPARAGLGSSAALAIAVGRLLASRAGRDDLWAPERSASLADGSEAVFHGRPSGVDAAVAAAGGVGMFRRPHGFARLQLSAPLHLVVADGGDRPPTSEMVRRVRERCEKDAEARRRLEKLGELPLSGADALARGDLPGLGEIMDDAHRLLCDLGVSTPGLDALVAEARQVGALGAKLTGAGGGGCVVALCTEPTWGAVSKILAEKARWSRHFVVPVLADPGAAFDELDGEEATAAAEGQE